MNILVYAVSGFNTIGGGRRVSFELLEAFAQIGYQPFIWSIYPYSPPQIYGSTFRPSSHSFFTVNNFQPLSELNQNTRREIAVAFQGCLQEYQVKLVLFDCEFSYQEFLNTFSSYLSWPSGVIRGALIHDQIWNGRPEAMFIPPCALDARSQALRLPYTPIWADYQSQRSRLIELTGQTFLPSPLSPTGFKKTLLWQIAHQLKTKATDYWQISQRKRAIRELDIIFTLTEQVHWESITAYGLSPNKVACAFGVTDYQSDNIPLIRDFHQESGSNDSEVILSFSRMAPEKFIEITLLAFAETLSQNPNRKLWIGGQIVPNQKAYFNFVKAVSSLLKIEDKITYWGALEETEMLNLYQQADCFICTQPADFNLSVYTALKLHKPVVVPTSYDFPDPLRNSSLIYQTTPEPTAIGAGIESALRQTSPSLQPKVLTFLKDLNFKTYAQSIIKAVQNISCL